MPNGKHSDPFGTVEFYVIRAALTILFVYEVGKFIMFVLGIH